MEIRIKKKDVCAETLKAKFPGVPLYIIARELLNALARGKITLPDEIRLKFEEHQNKSIRAPKTL